MRGEFFDKRGFADGRVSDRDDFVEEIGIDLGHWVEDFDGHFCGL